MEVVGTITASMESQGLQPVTTRVGSTNRITYTLPSGSTLVVVQQSSDVMRPQFSVGVGWGVYIYLNRSDQIVVAAGGAAGLGVLICAATTVIGCAAVAAALTGAATWIANRGGICSASTPRLEIRILGYARYSCVR